jgi:hypothetical protein
MTDAPLPNSAASSNPGDASIFGPVHLTRVMILIVAVIFAFVFKYAALWLQWPREFGAGGSLAQPPMALGAFVAVLGLLIVCTMLGTFLLGRRWFLAGLMTATAGLTMWSIRGGTITAVLFNADNSGAGGRVFLQMIGELIVFFGVIGGLWTLVWNVTGKSIADFQITPEASAKQAATVGKIKRFAMFGVTPLLVPTTADVTNPSPRTEEGRSAGTALLVQIALMVVLMLILAVTPLKKQVLTSVFLAGLISTAVAEYFFADWSTGRWYWLAPLIVGALGYLAAYFNPAGMETGDLQGMFAPLARALPLDYASMGCAGVLFGYWWMEPDADDAANSSDGENSAPASTSRDE